jgi:hypothetical protein
MGERGNRDNNCRPTLVPFTALKTHTKASPSDGVPGIVAPIRRLADVRGAGAHSARIARVAVRAEVVIRARIIFPRRAVNTTANLRVAAAAKKGGTQCECMQKPAAKIPVPSTNAHRDVALRVFRRESTDSLGVDAEATVARVRVALIISPAGGSVGRGGVGTDASAGVARPVRSDKRMRETGSLVQGSSVVATGTPDPTRTLPCGNHLKRSTLWVSQSKTPSHCRRRSQCRGRRRRSQHSQPSGCRRIRQRHSGCKTPHKGERRTMQPSPCHRTGTVRADTHPEPGSWHWLGLSQTIGVPPQSPLVHTSWTVHALSSLQPVPVSGDS